MFFNSESEYDDFFSRYEISNFKSKRIKRATNKRGIRTWVKRSGDEYVYVPYTISEKLCTLLFTIRKTK